MANPIKPRLDANHPQVELDFVESVWLKAYRNAEAELRRAVADPDKIRSSETITEYLARLRNEQDILLRHMAIAKAHLSPVIASALNVETEGARYGLS